MNQDILTIRTRRKDQRGRVRSRKISKPAYLKNCAQPNASQFSGIITEVFFFFFSDGLWLLDFYELVTETSSDDEPDSELP